MITFQRAIYGTDVAPRTSTLLPDRGPAVVPRRARGHRGRVGGASSPSPCRRSTAPTSTSPRRCRRRGSHRRRRRVEVVPHLDRTGELAQGAARPAPAAANYEEFQALHGIDVTVEQGETRRHPRPQRLGQVDAAEVHRRHPHPTTGEVRVRGRLASLLELGAGFHPDLTGRENVYINAAFYGMGRKEIDRVFDDIVEFAELAQFIDEPVKHYSSGMYVRLGFAVAVNLDPDVLLVDEVLAVGDEAFQVQVPEPDQAVPGRGPHDRVRHPRRRDRPPDLRPGARARPRPADPRRRAGQGDPRVPRAPPRPARREGGAGAGRRPPARSRRARSPRPRGQPPSPAARASRSPSRSSSTPRSRSPSPCSTSRSATATGR